MRSVIHKVHIAAADNDIKAYETKYDVYRSGIRIGLLFDERDKSVKEYSACEHMQNIKQDEAFDACEFCNQISNQRKR